MIRVWRPIRKGEGQFPGHVVRQTGLRDLAKQQHRHREIEDEFRQPVDGGILHEAETGRQIADRQDAEDRQDGVENTLHGCLSNRLEGALRMSKFADPAADDKRPLRGSQIFCVFMWTKGHCGLICRGNQ
jgi:hypothetical protein